MLMEIWKDVKGYEGYYKISNLGRIYILEKRFIDSIGRRRVLKAKYAKPTKAGNTYEFVRLTKNKEAKIKYIHRIVAENFLPLVEGKEWVNHIDGDKLNNKAENLEWCTPSENIRHAFDTGLNVHFRGVGSPNCKLNDEMVREIRKIREEENMSHRKIAAMFGVSATAIARILNGKAWTHVK